MDGMGWVVVLWLSGWGLGAMSTAAPVLGVSDEIGARLGGGRNVGAEFLFQEWLQ